MIALASPEQDPFSARYVHELNAHEWHVEEVYAQALAGVCSNTTRVLDCGANVGHTVALAAALGCHVTAYELQPRLHILTKLTAAANGWQDRVVLRSGVAPRPGTFGPFMYTPLGTSSGYPNVNMFPSTTGNCTQSDSPYCEKQVEIVNILEDFNTNIQFVKLDTDSNELELMLALIDKMNKTGLDIINFIVEGNMPVPMPTNSTPIYQLCVMGYHAFLLANPKLSPFYDPIASVMHRVKMKGYIEDAFYVKECTSLDTIIGHIRKWNGNFVGNWWLTKDKTQYAALVAPS
jgi:FkbM family methyltransferase